LIYDDEADGAKVRRAKRLFARPILLDEYKRYSALDGVAVLNKALEMSLRLLFAALHRRISHHCGCGY